jgi:hypothetical protein
VNRAQLEDVIRAASSIAEDDESVVIGSQAVLGQFPDAPAPMRVSMEADVFPRNRPERWDLIDGSIGEGSIFHATFGYYAQGVEERTAVLPDGWKERLVAVRGPGTRGATGWTLEIHDLLISKYVAGREKDLAFTDEAARHGMADPATLRDRLARTDVAPEMRSLVEGRIRSDYPSP